MKLDPQTVEALAVLQKAKSQQIATTAELARATARAAEAADYVAEAIEDLEAILRALIQKEPTL